MISKKIILVSGFVSAALLSAFLLVGLGPIFDLLNTTASMRNESGSVFPSVLADGSVDESHARICGSLGHSLWIVPESKSCVEKIAESVMVRMNPEIAIVTLDSSCSQCDRGALATIPEGGRRVRVKGTLSKRLVALELQFRSGGRFGFGAGDSASGYSRNRIQLTHLSMVRE